MAAKELSGVFTDTQKWAEAHDLLGGESCSVEHLRIYHNTPEQLEATSKALHGNCSVRTFEVGEAAGVGSQALAELLKVTFTISNLTIQSLPAAADVVALGHGLSCNTTLQALTIHSLTAEGVATVSTALAHSRTPGRLQQLRFPKCRLDAAAAAALHQTLLVQPCLALLSLQEACFLDSTASLTTSSRGSRISGSSTIPDSTISSFVPYSSSTGSETVSGSAAPASPASQLFTPSLAAHPRLSSLHLHKATGLAANVNGVQQLGAYLATAVQLQDVTLSEASMVQAAAEHLARAMDNAIKAPAARNTTSTNTNMLNTCTTARVPSFRVLDLSGNDLGLAGAIALGSVVGRRCKQLKVLRLADCELGGEGLSGLCSGLAEGGCQLLELDVSSNKVKGPGGLVPFLSSSAAQHLSILNLANNCLNDEAASQLASAVGSSCSSLTSLNLSQNWIGDDGAKALAAAIQRHSSLACVQLQQNRIRRTGIGCLADAALANKTVQEMCLDSNRTTGPMSKMALEDLTRALAQRRRGVGSNRHSSAAAAAPVSGGGLGRAENHSSRRVCSATAAAGDTRAGSMGLNSGRALTDTAAAEAVVAGAGEYSSNVGGMLADGSRWAAAPAPAIGYNQTDIIKPRASKVARLSDSSSMEAAAASSSDSSSPAPISPFATTRAAAAADPTALFQMPIGFADRLIQRGSSRSYSFEYWCQRWPPARQPATGAEDVTDTVSNTTDNPKAVVISLSTTAGAHGSPVSHNASNAVASVPGFASSLLGVGALGPLHAVPICLTDAKADSLSGWLLDDCFSAHMVLPDIVPGILRGASASRHCERGQCQQAV